MSLVQLRLFPTSQPRAIWCKVNIQNDITTCSFSADLLHCSLLISSGVKIFPGLYNFLGVNAVLVVTPSTYTLHVDMPPVKHATHITYPALLLRKQHPVYFRKQVNIILVHPRNLHGISAEALSCLL